MTESVQNPKHEKDVTPAAPAEEDVLTQYRQCREMLSKYISNNNEEMNREASEANKIIKELEQEYEFAYKTILEIIIKQFQQECNNQQDSKLKQINLDPDLLNKLKNRFIWDLQ